MGRRRTQTNSLVRTISALAALWCTSCGGPGGPPLYPVQGKVLVDGKPADGALVVFHPSGDAPPDALRPSAKVESDGSYKLSSRAPGDGAPAGEYLVGITWYLPEVA